MLTFRPLEEDSHEGAKIAWGVCEREVVSRESTTRNVLNRAHVLNVRWIFTSTGYPNGIQSISDLFLLNVLLEISWHSARQVSRVVVVLGLPAENLQLQRNIYHLRTLSSVTETRFIFKACLDLLHRLCSFYVVSSVFSSNYSVE